MQIPENFPRFAYYPGFHKYPLPKTRNDRGMAAEIMEARELWKRGNYGPRNFWKSWGAGIMEVNVECMQNAMSGHVWTAEWPREFWKRGN